MAKIGSWTMDLKISMNGQEVDFFDLNGESRHQIADLILNGYSNGMLYESEKHDDLPLNCIVYKSENASGETERDTVRFGDYAPMDTVFGSASHMYAFNDIEEREVELIRFHGEEYEYAGWQPGMTYSFTKKGETEEAWCGSFPHWDH